jgi:hypothetical protein
MTSLAAVTPMSKAISSDNLGSVEVVTPVVTARLYINLTTAGHCHVVCTQSTFLPNRDDVVSCGQSDVKGHESQINLNLNEPRSTEELPDFARKLKVTMNRPHYSLAKWTKEERKWLEIPPSLRTCTHVWVEHLGYIPPLTHPYSGPFPVVDRQVKYFRVRLDSGVVDSVSVDRLKAANLSDDVLGTQTVPCQVTRSGRQIFRPDRFQVGAIAWDRAWTDRQIEDAIPDLSLDFVATVFSAPADVPHRYWNALASIEMGLEPELVDFVQDNDAP